MNVLVLNGSPKKSGTVATLLQSVVNGIESGATTEWVDAYDLSIKPCIGCMKCRQTERCILPEDDGHKIGQKIIDADLLLIGTPTYWGNMSAQLKMVFERNVPLLMGESKNGIPVPKHKGKKAVIVTACTTPYPFNFILPESRGAVRSIKEILNYSGFKTKGVLTKAGTKSNPEITPKLLKKAAKLGARL